MIERTAEQIEIAHHDVETTLERWGGLWGTTVKCFVDLEPSCHYCDAASTRRIIVNVWGTGIERDVCDEHARFHGCGMDS